MKTLRRRRKEAKTDYKSRLALLKSGLPRLVVRKTNRMIIVQLVESTIAQDKVIVKADSSELLSKGWPKEKQGSLKNLYSSYLTGFLLVKKLKTLPKKVILDAGMYRNVHGSRIYAALKGAIDAGLNVSHDKASLPKDERFNNPKFKEIMTKIKEKL